MFQIKKILAKTLCTVGLVSSLLLGTTFLPTNAHNSCIADDTPQTSSFSSNSRLFPNGMVHMLGISSVAMSRVNTRIIAQIHGITGHAHCWHYVTTAFNHTRIPALNGNIYRIDDEFNNAGNQSEVMLRVSHRIHIREAYYRRDEVDHVLLDLGIVPDLETRNTHSPAGIANLIADDCIGHFDTDGANRLGDMDRTYNRMNYSDYTNYEPVNTLHKVNDIDKWQPLAEYHRGSNVVLGEIVPQQHIGGHIGKMNTITGFHPEDYPMPAPTFTFKNNPGRFRQKVNIVINELQKTVLNDTRKMIGEYGEDKLALLSQAVNYALNFHGDNFMQVGPWTKLQLAAHVAQHDAMIWSWYWKVQHDAVRPITAVRELFPNRKMLNWVNGEGPKLVRGREWNSYIGTCAHSDHPSATACLCYAVGAVLEKYIGGDEIDFSQTFPKGSSYIDPSLPKEDVVLNYKSIDHMMHDCAYGRVMIGVHFPESVEVREQCKAIGYKAYEHMYGNNLY